jgi:hypothetical protein
MLIKVNKSFIKLPIMHFAGTGSKAGTMLIKVNKSFKLLIMHFAGTGSKAGTMLIKVNKSFNIHLITVNEYYILSRLIKGPIKNTYSKYNGG